MLHPAIGRSLKDEHFQLFIVSDNMLCQVFKDVAMDELALLPSNSY